MQQEIKEILTEALDQSISCQEIPCANGQREHEVDDFAFFESLREKEVGMRMAIAAIILDGTGTMFRLDGDHVWACSCGGVFNATRNKCDNCDYQIDYSTIPF